MNVKISNSKKYKYNSSLDFIRFISVSFVILDHWRIDTSNKNLHILLSFINDGRFGVDIFFVISGFLITYGLLLQKDSVDFTFKKDIASFYIKRFFRIFPIYYLLIFFLYIINFNDTRTNFLYYATYSSNILISKYESWNIGLPHTWSLSVEEQFYLIWPFVVFCIPRKYLLKISGLLILLSLVFISIFKSDVIIYFITLLPSCLMTLSAGTILAIYYKYNLVGLNRHKKSIYLVGIFALLIYIFIKIFNLQYVLLNKMVYTSFAFSSILYAINNPNKFKQMPFVYLGKISYGIYLYHYVIGQIPNKYFIGISASFWLIYIVKLILLFSISVLSYNYFESRLINFAKKKLSHK